MDNGSGLRAGLVRSLLERHRVLALFSPARTPEYNGAIEAGIGAGKERTEEHAQRRGTPGEWTWEDAAGGRGGGHGFWRRPPPPPRRPREGLGGTGALPARGGGGGGGGG